MSSADASSRCAERRLRLVLDLRDGHRQRRAADRGRPAAVGAPAHRRVVGVAVHDLHVVDVDAELARDNLRERRLFPLAVRRGADEDVDLAGGMEAHDRALPQPALEADGAGHLRRSEAADLDIGAMPMPMQRPLAAGFGLLALGAVVVGVGVSMSSAPW